MAQTVVGGASGGDITYNRAVQDDFPIFPCREELVTESWIGSQSVSRISPDERKRKTSTFKAWKKKREKEGGKSCRRLGGFGGRNDEKMNNRE